MAKPESDTGPMMYSNTLLVYSVVTEGRKPQIWPCFQLQHSVVAPASGAETKSNATAQLQTFPYLAYQNCYYIQTLTQTLLFKNVMVKINKKSNFVTIQARNEVPATAGWAG